MRGGLGLLAAEAVWKPGGKVGSGASFGWQDVSESDPLES